GFVGGALIAALRARGVFVRALARSEAAAAKVAAHGGEVVAGDLGDAAALGAGMRGCDVVFHAAAHASDVGPRATFFAVNVAGTQNALAAARAAGVPRFLHVSTEAVLAGGRPL